MKKILLLISSLIISITAFAATGQLNAYAYGAGYIYDANKQELAVSWSQQAEASAVRIVAVDADENRYPIKTYGTTSAGRHEKNIDLWELIDAGLMPTNKNLRIEIEVKTARTKHEVIGKINGCTLIPYSIDIDNNPYSACFGLMYVTHMNSNASRGIRVLDQWGTDRGLKQSSFITSLGSDNWYNQSRGIPHMVRVIQDGTGRLLVTSSDKTQETHLWLVNPELDANNIPKLNTWNTVITSTDWKSQSWTNHDTYGSKDKIANAAIDIRENGNNLDILLLAASFSSTTTGHSAGQAYSGVYSVANNRSDLKGGSYIPYTAPTGAEYDDHPYIGDEYMGSTFTANANFDKYGGVFYNAHTEQSTREPNGPALIHRTTSGEFQKYTDGDYLKRKNLATKGVRFNQDFTKIAIAQGKNMTNELRIYDVSQSDGNSHPVLSNGVSVDLIANSTADAYIHDIAWDYAQNIFVTIRNATSGPSGLYAVATNIGSKAIITPAGGTPFRVECDANTTYNISLVQSGGTGTLEGGGYYASCSKVTIVAKPDNQFKFVAWKEGDAVVSTNSTYSFYVTKDRTLTAVFEGAVYNNITWWNLFENGQDITTIGRDANDDKLNNRLWYLFMPMFNEYAPKTSRADNGKAGSYNEFNVMGFTSTSYDYKVKDFMENVNSPFYWLGKYIQSVTGKNTFTDTQWRKELYAFFNRTNYSRNSQGTIYTDYSTGDYRSTGHPNYWRSYWTNIACSNSEKLGNVLHRTMTYNDPMPTDWNKISAPSSYVTHDPKSWYKWNQVTSPPYYGHSDTHIRAWRKDGVKGPIITRVEEDNLRLYNTYVKKHIQEDDPEPDMSEDYPQDATNSDIFRLLFNKNWESDGFAHKLTITRKIQGGMYNTICFPFKVFLGDNGSMPNDNPFKQATFWKYIGTSSKYNESGEPVTILEFQPETEVLEAGVPYLVRSDNDITKKEILFGAEGDSKRLGYTHVFCDSVPKTVPAREGSPVPITFVGTINPTEVPAESLILVANNRLAQTTTKGKMLGMRGYFTIDPMWAAEIGEQAADGRVYLSMHKPTTTSIPVAPEAEQQTKPEVRKIMRDGQIYILRGDEVYTITGNRVR